MNAIPPSANPYSATLARRAGKRVQLASLTAVHDAAVALRAAMDRAFPLGFPNGGDGAGDDLRVDVQRMLDELIAMPVEVYADDLHYHVQQREFRRGRYFGVGGSEARP